MSTEETAALFMNGGSQAVRLPKEFRMPGKAVRIRREGNAVILEPMEKARWPRGYWARLQSLAPVPEDFELPESLPSSSSRDEVLDEFEG